MCPAGTPVRRRCKRWGAIGHPTLRRYSVVSTDEFVSYGLLTPDGFMHGAVQHGAGEFAYYDYRHDVTHHFKNCIHSTHIHVSATYMDRCVAELAFSSNKRGCGMRCLIC